MLISLFVSPSAIHLKGVWIGKRYLYTSEKNWDFFFRSSEYNEFFFFVVRESAFFFSLRCASKSQYIRNVFFKRERGCCRVDGRERGPLFQYYGYGGLIAFREGLTRFYFFRVVSSIQSAFIYIIFFSLSMENGIKRKAGRRRDEGQDRRQYSGWLWYQSSSSFTATIPSTRTGK